MILNRHQTVDVYCWSGASPTECDKVIGHNDYYGCQSKIIVLGLTRIGAAARPSTGVWEGGGVYF